MHKEYGKPPGDHEIIKCALAPYEGCRNPTSFIYYVQEPNYSKHISYLNYPATCRCTEHRFRIYEMIGYIEISYDEFLSFQLLNM